LDQSLSTVHKAIQKWAGGSGLNQFAIQHLLRMEGVQPMTWLGTPGNIYYLRTMPHHRIIWVAEGSMIVELPEEGRWIKLEKGDRLDLPPGAPHQIVVGKHGVVCLEAHGKQMTI
jgi:quercetin dioxygenase-like cupin family protein